jgi:predicted glycosyltransferase
VGSLTKSQSETGGVIAFDHAAGLNAKDGEKRAPGRGVIWIDLDNSPHVPFFRPIIQELEARGYSIVLTARDCFQVCGLAEQFQIKCDAIGRHYGKNRAMKLLGLGIRALQLLPKALRARPTLAVSHGSRSQLMAAKLLGIPTLQILDYEFAKGWIFTQPSWVMTPDMIPDGDIKSDSSRIVKYPGIKEDVYVPAFTPDGNIRRNLGISESDILVTLRPPASEAHYHNPESDVLFKATVDYLGRFADTTAVVLPRTDRQGETIRAEWPDLCSSGKLLIPSHVVDGLNLIWHSDLVISGGGTMNREAAALGIPVYSVFRGKTGAVDRFLEASGRLVMLESPHDLPTKLIVRRRDRAVRPGAAGHTALNVVANHITRLAELET